MIILAANNRAQIQKSLASKSVTIVGRFAGLAYMLRVKFSLFNVQPHPRVNAHRIMYAAVAGATVDGHSRHCCSFAILNLSRTIFAVDVFAIVDHFTVFHPLAMSYLI